MPKYVLTYFNFKGLGEGCRMLLAYGEQEFEDRRIEIADWLQCKDNYPFRQLPVLEIDGKEFAQSIAICRYLGHKFGLAGDNLEENLEIDQNIDFFIDIRNKFSLTFAEDPEVRNKKIEENLQNNGWMWEKLHEIVTNNNGHLACGKLTWADFVVAGAYSTLKFMMQQQLPDVDAKYPSFKKLQDSVFALPKVKEFIAKAPPTKC